MEDKHEVNTYNEIAEQIRRMRSKQVEPERVIVSRRVYALLGSPNRISGVAVDCDDMAKSGFEVR